MLQNKISVNLITGNGEENIGDWLETIKWTEEVISEKLHHRILSPAANDISGYFINRENYLPGNHITSYGWEKYC